MASPSDWSAKPQERRQVLTAQPANFMAATLGRDQVFSDGMALPPLWHWLYFLEAKPLQELGRDGHPQKGDFLPPTTLPRRMWAGGRFQFHKPLLVGGETLKRSCVTNVTQKTGRSGALCFVTVLHEMFQGGDLALSEEHDIVYREDPSPSEAQQPIQQAPANAQVSEVVQPSEVLLFRYSALLMNGHRIHYDLDYAQKTEGYEGLVFHGPLTATLLVDLAQRQAGRRPNSFSFRGVAPISGMSAFHIETSGDAEHLTLWARRSDGALAMKADAYF